MQTKTFLALFCTIVVLLIGVNDGAPTSPKSVTAKTTTTTTTTTVAPVVVLGPVKNVGGRSQWKTKVDPKSKKLFNAYKKAIAKKLQAVHKVAPTFQPKPEKVASQLVSGVLYHYLVKVPSNKYAYVTILSQKWKKGQLGNEDHVTVRPQLYALTDKNI